MLQVRREIFGQIRLESINPSIMLEKSTNYTGRPDSRRRPRRPRDILFEMAEWAIIYEKAATG